MMMAAMTMMMAMLCGARREALLELAAGFLVWLRLARLRQYQATVQYMFCMYILKTGTTYGSVYEPQNHTT